VDDKNTPTWISKLLDIPFGEDPAILPSPTFDGDITIDVLSFMTQEKEIDSYLVGGFKPSEKYVCQIGSFLQIVMNN